MQRSTIARPGDSANTSKSTIGLMSGSAGGYGALTISSRRAPRVRGRDEFGLTTLEWLLIVAAVAALAALAVVLVQNVVEGTSEQVSSQNARQVAAKVAADGLLERARNANPEEARFATWAAWERHFTRECELLKILYGDAVEKINAWVERPFNVDADAKPIPGELAATLADDGNLPDPDRPEARVYCEVDY